MADARIPATTETFRARMDLTQRDHIEGLPLGTRGGMVVQYNFPVDAEYEIRPKLWANTVEQIGGLEHPDTLKSINSLASINMDQGQFEEARKLLEETLPIHRRVFGLEHSYTLLVMQNLAKAHYAATEFGKKAKILFPRGKRFNEFVVQTKEDPHAINDRLLEKKMVGGLSLKKFYPELGNASLWCCTEMTTRSAIDTAAGLVAESERSVRSAKEEVEEVAR